MVLLNGDVFDKKVLVVAFKNLVLGFLHENDRSALWVNIWFGLGIFVSYVAGNDCLVPAVSQTVKLETASQKVSNEHVFVVQLVRTQRRS